MRYILGLVVALTLSAVANADDWVNTRVNEDTTTELQNEEQIVVNPANPNNLVAVWRDFRLGYRQVGFGYTMDGGVTWSNPGLFVDPHYVWDSDPALTVSADGTFYAMLLGYTGSTYEPNGMLLYRSTDGGQSWEERGFAVNEVPDVFEDKEFIACDRTGSSYHGRIYMVWSRFYNADIYFVSSGNEGSSWTSERLVSDQTGNQFPIPAVGPDGTLYVAWTRFNGAIWFDRSTDGGLTFGNDIYVTDLYTYSTTLNGNVDAPSHPAMDVDISGGPYNGRIYIAYMNRISGSNDYDIFLRYSDNQGATWSADRRINDDPFGNGCDQFHPWLTVDNTGAVSAVWLDRRQDPQNRKWHCYVAQSTDGGMTWTPNQQVSTAPSDPSGIISEPEDISYDAEGEEERSPEPTDFDGLYRPHQEDSRAGTIGEYIGIASWDGYITTIWTDTRHGHQDAYGGAQELQAIEEGPHSIVRPHLRLAPNPTQGPVAVQYDVPADGPVSLEVFDVGGRMVRTLIDRKLRSGTGEFIWDGTDQAGRPVNPGSYWFRLRAQGIEESGSIRLQR